MSDEEEGEPQACGLSRGLQATLRCMRKQWLLITMLTAVLMSVIVGLIVRAVFLTPQKPRFSRREIMYTGFLGQLFVRTLRAVTIPLFMFSVISALARLNMRTSGKMGLRTFIYFISTSFCATIFAVIIVTILEPGKSVTDREKFGQQEVKPSLVIDNILDFFRNFVPNNIIAACLTGTRTELIIPEKGTEGETADTYDWPFEMVLSGQTNYLGLVTIAAAIGLLMSYMESEAGYLYRLLNAINDVFIKITIVTVWLSSPCIFSLMLAQVMEITDWTETLRQMGLYTIANIVGLCFIGMVFLPSVYAVILRRWPFKFMYQTFGIVTTAFVTSSSMATMPMTLTILEDRVGINPHVTRFVVPLGATVNMNGAAFYETIAPLFLAQMHNIDLNVGHYLAVCSMAALASVGVAGIPQGAIVTMVMVMNIVGVPPEDISIVLAMDWLLDRIDTATNTFGDAVGCAIVEHLSRKELENLGPFTAVE